MGQKIKVEGNEKRKIHFNMIRIFAIILVIFNHTNEKGFFLFSITENEVTTGMTWIRASNVGELSEFGNGLFLTGLTAIPAVTVYCGLKYFSMHHLINKTILQILQWISRDVFTIYLIEERVREMTEGIDELLIPVIGWMPSCFVWIFCIMIICIAIAEILRRIPGIKKLL